MSYIKYVLMILGLAVVGYAKSKYTKRVQTDKSSLVYSTNERYVLWFGYALLGLAILLAAVNI